MDNDYYLGEGAFTHRDARVKEVAKSITGSSKGKALSNYISSLRVSGFNPELFRQRTASQIIESGFVTGCSEIALVFLVLARELGTPAKYVETFSEEWLASSRDSVEGHVFADLFVNGQWRAYEPIRGSLKDGIYRLGNGLYRPVGKGLDFSDLHLISPYSNPNQQSNSPATINLTTLDQMKQLMGRKI